MRCIPADDLGDRKDTFAEYIPLELGRLENSSRRPSL